jgi:acetate kinase
MILIINAGSSSIKFALHASGHSLSKTYDGALSRIGSRDMRLVVNGKKQMLPDKIADYLHAITFLAGWLKEHTDFKDINAIGHRVVHGMQHTKPALVTTKLLTQLKQIVPYDPDHLPNEIKLIETFQKQLPALPQYVCFDTAFHHTMPRVAQLLPIPHRFEKQGIRRYGFHGLSYQFLLQELENIAGKKAAMGRVILAHLGSGASLVAVYKGKSMDTSMGFTPAGGIPMSTRSGDLDPGVAWVMMKKDNLSPKQFNNLINHESGLLGISGTSGDMSDLVKSSASDKHAADAVNLFCYQVKKWIGAYIAVLGGLDFLIFSGGIGENSPVIRNRICEGLGFFGIEVDYQRNLENAPFISANESRVTIRIIPTDEELIIAKTVNNILKKNKLPKKIK